MEAAGGVRAFGVLSDHVYTCMKVCKDAFVHLYICICMLLSFDSSSCC